jgi:VWFA-related protein
MTRTTTSRRLTFVVAGAIAVAATMRPATGQQTQTPTFRASAAAVMVDVSVQRQGRPVTGLDAGDFVVLDNGVEQHIASISYGKLPIDVTVALDVSFSVSGGLLDRLRRAVRDLMGDLESQDRLKLMLFGGRITRVVDFTTDVDAVERSLRTVSAGGGTTLLDAVSTALISASHPDRRQLVVFFTDGRDSASITSPDALVSIAQRTTARLTAVVPSLGPAGGPFRPTPETVQAMRYQADQVRPLGRAAGETGGSVMTISGGADLSSTFRRILEEFRSTYVLHFAPRGVDRGGFHTLQVSVRRDGVIVRARRGYFGG